MGDMWILSDYLNVMLLKHDGRIKCQPFDVRSIQSNVEKWKYNQKLLSYSHNQLCMLYWRILTYKSIVWSYDVIQHAIIYLNIS